MYSNFYYDVKMKTSNLEVKEFATTSPHVTYRNRTYLSRKMIFNLEEKLPSHSILREKLQKIFKILSNIVRVTKEYTFPVLPI